MLAAIHEHFSVNAPAILSFTGICFLVIILHCLSKGILTNAFFSAYKAPFTSPFTYLRMVTHVFGHASWSHFIGNITVILLVGPLLEEKYGTATIILVMFLAAFVSGALHTIVSPVRLMGASGIAFSLMTMASFTSVTAGYIPLTTLLVTLIYLSGILVDIVKHKEVSSMAHIVGGAVGMFAGLVLNGFVG